MWSGVMGWVGGVGVGGGCVDEWGSGGVGWGGEVVGWGGGVGGGRGGGVEVWMCGEEVWRCGGGDVWGRGVGGGGWGARLRTDRPSPQNTPKPRRRKESALKKQDFFVLNLRHEAPPEKCPWGTNPGRGPENKTPPFGGGGGVNCLNQAYF